MAPASDLRRRGTGGGTPRPRSGSSANSLSRSGSPRPWLAVAGVVLLLLAVYLLARHRGAAAALNTSGTPGPDLSGSAAQQPNGGAASVPGNLPPLLVDQPDPLTGQVQQTSTSSGEAPTMLSTTTRGDPGVTWSNPVPPYYREQPPPVQGPGPADPQGYSWKPTPWASVYTPVTDPTSAVKTPGNIL